MNLYAMSDFGLVALGLGMLWWAGDLVVHYAILVAERFKVSTFFLGFIVLAIAADIPELAIAISSALSGATEVSVGNLIGANFTDVAMVVGTTLLIAGHKIQIKASDRYLLLRMLTIIIGILLLIFGLGTLGKWHGLGLMLVYAASLIWLWKKRSTTDILHEEVEAIKKEEIKDQSTKSTVILIAKLAASVATVMVVSSLTVDYAVKLAVAMHWPLEVIGATILGVGTSLPELALSLGALRRGEYALAVGPTLGTVLGQTTLILGLLSFLSEKPISLAGVHLSAAFMFLGFGCIGFGLIKKQPMGRWLGALLLVLFGAYMVCHIRGMV